MFCTVSQSLLRLSLADSNVDFLLRCEEQAEDNQCHRDIFTDVGTVFKNRGNQLLNEVEKINQHTLCLLEYTDWLLRLVAAIEREQKDLLTVTIERILELEVMMLITSHPDPHQPAQTQGMVEWYRQIVDARMATRQDSDMELDSSDAEVSKAGTSAKHVPVLKQAPSEIQVLVALIREVINLTLEEGARTGNVRPLSAHMDIAAANATALLDLTAEEGARAGNVRPSFSPMDTAAADATPATVGPSASDTGAAALEPPEAMLIAIPTINIIKATPEQVPAVPQPRGCP
jgi:hypothetical protein